MTLYEEELVERHWRINNGMDALSRVSGLDGDKVHAALETLRAAREVVEGQIQEERREAHSATCSDPKTCTTECLFTGVPCTS